MVRKMKEEHTVPEFGVEIKCDQRSGIKQLRTGFVTLEISKENDDEPTKCGMYQNEIQNISHKIVGLSISVF